MKELDKLFTSEKYTKMVTQEEFEKMMLEENDEIPISEIDFSSIKIKDVDVQK